MQMRGFWYFPKKGRTLKFVYTETVVLNVKGGNGAKFAFIHEVKKSYPFLHSFSYPVYFPGLVPRDD